MTAAPERERTPLFTFEHLIISCLKQNINTLSQKRRNISPQKEYLEDFAGRNGFRNIRHFTDDGVSGTTFEREGFQKMIAEVEAGNVGTVIVKDCCAIIGLNQKDLENTRLLA